MTQDLKPYDLSQFQTWKWDMEAPNPIGLQVIPMPSSSVNNQGTQKPGLILNWIWDNRHIWANPVLPACGIISPKHVGAQPAVTCPLTAVGQCNTCDTSQIWARGARLEGANKPCHIPHPSPGTGPHLAVPAVFFLFPWDQPQDINLGKSQGMAGVCSLG